MESWLHPCLHCGTQENSLPLSFRSSFIPWRLKELPGDGHEENRGHSSVPLFFYLLSSFSPPAPKCRYSPRELPESILFKLHKARFPIFLVSSANFLSYYKREERPQGPFPGSSPLKGYCLRFTLSPPFFSTCISQFADSMEENFGSKRRCWNRQEAESHQEAF